MAYKASGYELGTRKPKKEEPTTPNPPAVKQDEKPATTQAQTQGLYSGFGYNPYQESQAVIDARNAMNAHNSNPLAQWTGGTYGAALQQAMDRIVNREKFSYDLNADALYQQYKDRYIGLGKMAMQDTMGQASAMTGGYGNSYAQTAGNQSYQGYLQGLNDKVPELYQLAYDKYNNEGQQLLDNFDMYNNLYNTEYGQYRDRVNDWYAESDRLTNAYYNAYNQDYGLYSDNYSRALQMAQYNQSVAEKNRAIKASTPAYTPDIDPYLQSGLTAARARLQSGDMSLDEFKAFAERFMTPDETNSYLAQYGYDYNAQSPATPMTPVADGSAYKKFVDNHTNAKIEEALRGRGVNPQKYMQNEIIDAVNSGTLTDDEARELFKKYGITSFI